jgi:hypothetical protein
MSSFERKTLPNGKENPKYIDLCDEDVPIAGQKFACLSFVSPERILKKREMFLFENFVRQWDFTKSIEKFNGFLQYLSYKYSLNVEEVMADFVEFAKEEDAKLKEVDVTDDYKNFLDKQEERLNAIFQKENGFQTSVRGLKVRGVFPSQDEAELKCKKLRESDPNHDIFVGPVGMWIPWDPDAYKTGRVEFMEEELNQLHNEKIKNEIKAKEEFDTRIRDAKKKAIEENIANAKKSGNVLTQTLDEEGNLMGVKETTDFDSREVAEKDTTVANQEIVGGILEKEVVSSDEAS